MPRESKCTALRPLTIAQTLLGAAIFAHVAALRVHGHPHHHHGHESQAGSSSGPQRLRATRDHSVAEATSPDLATTSRRRAEHGPGGLDPLRQLQGQAGESRSADDSESIPFACGTAEPEFEHPEDLALPDDHGKILEAVYSTPGGGHRRRRLQDLAVETLTFPMMIFHVIRKANGTGTLSDSQLQTQFDVLNAAFAPHIQFGAWQRRDYADSALHDTLCDLSNYRAMWAFKENHAVTTALNSYYADCLAHFLYGYAHFPNLAVESSPYHGVVLDYRSIDHPWVCDGGCEGDTGVHEWGHAFGLYHTFQSQAVGNACDCTWGDYVDDTPPESTPHFGGIEDACAPRDSCFDASGAADPITNYMDYSDDSCADHFTEGQFVRMLYMLALYKPNLLAASLNAADATACIAGTYYDATEGACKLCPEGAYQDETGQTACKTCAEGLSDEVILTNGDGIVSFTNGATLRVSEAQCYTNQGLGCVLRFYANKYCDQVNNRQECFFDGGDCCAECCGVDDGNPVSSISTCGDGGPSSANFAQCQDPSCERSEIPDYVWQEPPDGQCYNFFVQDASGPSAAPVRSPTPAPVATSPAPTGQNRTESPTPTPVPAVPTPVPSAPPVLSSPTPSPQGDGSSPGLNCSRYDPAVSILFPFGDCVNDATFLPVADDGSAEAPLSISFPFYAESYDSLWVNHNGILSLTYAFGTYTTLRFPLFYSGPLIAPYWADVDISNFGQISFHEVLDAATLESADGLLQSSSFALPAGYVSTWGFLATWDEVTYFLGDSTTPRNTFQVLLLSDGTRSFALFIYEDLAWSRGSASPLAGFNEGDGVNSYVIPTDPNDPSDVVNLDERSNIGVVGIFAFAVDGPRIGTGPGSPSAAPTVVPSALETATPSADPSSLATAAPAIDCSLSASNATRLFPFGACVEDAIFLPIEDDGGEEAQLSISFPFYAESYDSLWVNHNGVLSFGALFWSYSPRIFPIESSGSLMLPYWADVDISNFGQISYHEILDPASLERGDILLQSSSFALPAGYVSTWGFLATWDEVTYFFGDSTTPRNTFQILLLSDGTHSYTLFLYADLTWPGSSSPALAGFNKGDGVNSYLIPTDPEDVHDIMNLDERSNIGIEGIFAFRVNGATIQPSGATTAPSASSSTSPPTSSPTKAPTMASDESSTLPTSTDTPSGTPSPTGPLPPAPSPSPARAPVPSDGTSAPTLAPGFGITGVSLSFDIDGCDLLASANGQTALQVALDFQVCRTAALGQISGAAERCAARTESVLTASGCGVEAKEGHRGLSSDRARSDWRRLDGLETVDHFATMWVEPSDAEALAIRTGVPREELPSWVKGVLRSGLSDGESFMAGVEAALLSIMGELNGDTGAADGLAETAGASFSYDPESIREIEATDDSETVPRGEDDEAGMSIITIIGIVVGAVGFLVLVGAGTAIWRCKLCHSPSQRKGSAKSKERAKVTGVILVEPAITASAPVEEVKD